MFAFDCALMIVTGQTLALSARKQLAKEKSYLANKYFVLGIFWATLIHIPTSVCHYFGWTAWNIGYWFNPFPTALKEPSYLAIFFSWLHCFLCNSLFMGAFLLGHRWIRGKKQKLLVIVSVVTTVLLFVYWGVFFQRNFTITGWENFQTLAKHGIKFYWGGLSFFGHPVMWINFILIFLDLGPLFFLYYWFDKEGKKGFFSKVF